MLENEREGERERAEEGVSELVSNDEGGTLET